MNEDQLEVKKNIFKVIQEEGLETFKLEEVESKLERNQSSKCVGTLLDDMCSESSRLDKLEEENQLYTKKNYQTEISREKDNIINLRERKAIDQLYNTLYNSPELYERRREIASEYFADLQRFRRIEKASKVIYAVDNLETENKKTSETIKAYCERKNQTKELEFVDYHSGKTN